MMIDQKHLESFSRTLWQIAEQEIALGNRIVETHSGWPDPETVMVFLEKPFIREYGQLPVEYREINDPHYWKSEYFDKTTGHVLACKYDG